MREVRVAVLDRDSAVAHKERDHVFIRVGPVTVRSRAAGLHLLRDELAR
jgi:hypothetical protein